MSELRKTFPFTKVVMDELEETMYQQDVKGFAKYKQALDPHDEKYDWLEMADEELVDLAKYMKAEKHKRDAILEKVFNELDELKQYTTDQFTLYKIEVIRHHLGILIPSKIK